MLVCSINWGEGAGSQAQGLSSCPSLGSSHMGEGYMPICTRKSGGVLRTIKVQKEDIQARFQASRGWLHFTPRVRNPKDHYHWTGRSSNYWGQAPA